MDAIHSINIIRVVKRVTDNVEVLWYVDLVGSLNASPFADLPPMTCKIASVERYFEGVQTLIDVRIEQRESWNPKIFDSSEYDALGWLKKFLIKLRIMKKPDMFAEVDMGYKAKHWGDLGVPGDKIGFKVGAVTEETEA